MNPRFLINTDPVPHGINIHRMLQRVEFKDKSFDICSITCTRGRTDVCYLLVKDELINRCC